MTDDRRHPAPDAELTQFGFDDDSESWIEQLRAAERPETLFSVGRFQLLEEVARGGQGVVYRGHDPDTSRAVAVKIMRAGRLAPSSLIARVERELEATARLDHPAIVTLYGAEWIDGAPALVMRWIDGLDFVSWAHREDEETPSRHAIVSTFCAVCAGVQHAHQHGVVHRDLKPSNVLVDATGAPFVLDFGLARMIDTAAPVDSGITRDGVFLGTMRYAAPEQRAHGAGHADVRSDVFALGLMLLEALTEPTDESDSVRRARHGVDQLADRNLAAVLATATAAEPTSRYATADALRGELQRWLDDRPVEARRPGRLEQLRRTVRQHRATSTGIAVAVLALLTLTLALGLTALRARAEAERAQLAERLFDDAMASIAAGVPARRVSIADVLGAVEAQLERTNDLDVATRARLLTTLAMRHALFGNWVDAERLARHVQALLDGHGESQSAGYARALQLIGGAAAIRGEAGAVELQQRSVALFAQATGAESLETTIARSELAWTYWKYEAADDAEIDRLMRESLEGFERHGAGSSADAAIARVTWGQWLASQKRFEEADRAYTRAMSDLEATRGVGDLRWFHAAMERATTLDALQRTEDADAHLQATIDRAAAAGQIIVASTLLWVDGDRRLARSIESGDPDLASAALQRFDAAIELRAQRLPRSAWRAGDDAWSVLWREQIDQLLNPRGAADAWCQAALRAGEVDAAQRLMTRLEAEVARHDDAPAALIAMLAITHLEIDAAQTVSEDLAARIIALNAAPPFDTPRCRARLAQLRAQIESKARTEAGQSPPDKAGAPE